MKTNNENKPTDRISIRLRGGRNTSESNGPYHKKVNFQTMS